VQRHERFRRAGRNANSAIVVAVGPDDYGRFRRRRVLAGVEYQRTWERLAFAAPAGHYALPVQTLGDFMARALRLPSAPWCRRSLERTLSRSVVLPPSCVASGIAAACGISAAPSPVSTARRGAVGVETRTSSPVRILRDEACSAPCRASIRRGRSGYAGGIMVRSAGRHQGAEKVLED
jgi:uncharacterized FAD-dependent dehydrogenase